MLDLTNEPHVGQTIKLLADEERGWPEEVGVYHGEGVVTLLPAYRDGAGDDGLREVDLGLNAWEAVGS